MKTRFKTEKRAREETIGRATTMARAAIAAGREFNDRESRKVEALLSTAEALGLGKKIPRKARALAAFATNPVGKQMPIDPNAKL
jgi:hypothetical protein